MQTQNERKEFLSPIMSDACAHAKSGFERFRLKNILKNFFFSITFKLHCINLDFKVKGPALTSDLVNDHLSEDMLVQKFP